MYAPHDDMFVMSELIPVENRPYQIGELAEKFGVTLRTIRFYEQKGLMKPRRIGSNMRIFDAADVARLGLIVTCRRFRFTVDEIAALLTLRDRLGAQEFRAHLVAALTARRAALVEEIEESRKLIDELGGFLTGLDHRA
ncbi:MerR family transcriptional regulator [Pinisolibacter sp.]|uniref:MerR family transcriptional regulator n=1 Tax=Pinisolibacter sp. TaxID=2172024 RepID=UPI002FDC8D6B